MSTEPKEPDAYTEAETEARREAALKRMLTTPHKPHKPKNANVSGSTKALHRD